MPVLCPCRRDVRWCPGLSGPPGPPPEHRTGRYRCRLSATTLHSRPKAARGISYDDRVAQPISKQDVAHVARLARLGLTEEELERFTTQLAAVLEHAADIAALEFQGCRRRRTRSHSLTFFAKTSPGPACQGTRSSPRRRK